MYMNALSIRNQCAPKHAPLATSDTRAEPHRHRVKGMLTPLIISLTNANNFVQHPHVLHIEANPRGKDAQSPGNVTFVEGIGTVRFHHGCHLSGVAWDSNFG